MSLATGTAPLIDSTNGKLFGGCYIWDEGAEIHLEAQTPTATRTIVCNYSDFPAIISAIQGDISEGEFILPIVWPGISFLFFQRASLKQIPTAPGYIFPDPVYGLAVTDLARVALEFRKLPFDPQTIATGELHVDYRQQSEKLPASLPLLEIVGSNYQIPAQDNPLLFYGTASFEITFYNLTSSPFALNLAAANKVNSDTFYGAAPGTMKYSGMSDRKTLGYGFGNLWNVTFSFDWLEVGWNSHFDPTPGVCSFQPTKFINAPSGSGSPPQGGDGINGPLYQATAFTPLFSGLT